MEIKNLLKLISETKAEAKSKFAIENDMVDMYTEDAADYEKVMKLIKAKQIDEAREKLEYMDTAPREAAVMAIFEDTDANFVYNLGWTIN